MKQCVLDTSALLAALLNEPEKESLVKCTEGVNLLAPHSLHWEIGNALSAMFKRGRISLKETLAILKAYESIPIQFVDVDLSKALKISHSLNIYAYDAYMITCADTYKSPLITLDKSLRQNARQRNLSVVEI